MKGFKDFILKGNVVSLAVAVLIGVAFGALVTAFTKDFLTPLIGAIGGKPNFSALLFRMNSSKFYYGDFINAVITFVIDAAVIYFAIVLPMTRLQARRAATPDPDTKDCPECLSSIPLAATRCAFCTVEQPA